MILLEDSDISLDEVLDVLKKRKEMIDIKNYNNENIFAKILRNEIPSEKVYENDHVYAFNDINPQVKRMF